MIDANNMPTMVQINKKKKDYTAVSLFSGCGGSSTGYKMAGFNVMLASEFVEEAAKTYAANHPGTIVDTRDIRTVQAKDILKQIGLKKGELDLLDGSPPCHPTGTIVYIKRNGVKQYVDISEVLTGDEVLTHLDRWRTVTGTTKTKYSGYLIGLHTVWNKPLYVTPNHGMFTRLFSKLEPTWTHAQSIREGDALKVPKDDDAFNARGELPEEYLNIYESVEDYCDLIDPESAHMFVRVSKVTHKLFEGYVYNLHVEEDESYTADGFASHNCSAFSTAGKRDEGWGEEKKYSDDKVQRVDDLFFEFTRMLKGIYPKTFIAENVEGLVQGAAKGYFLEILNELRACGYIVEARVLNAAYLGVPQARRRLIFMGVRKDLKIQPVFPRARSRPLTVKECLPNIRYIKSKENGILTYIPSDIPSPTVTASDGSTSETAGFSCGGFVETDRGVRRKYTIEELKVIFGFPEDFKLTGKFEQQWERLGRSHVPLQAYALARQIRKHVLDVYYGKS